MGKRLTTRVKGIKFHATIFPAENPNKLYTLVCLPGGGASAQYFNLSRQNSFAKRMVSKGYNVLTLDHPGTATNPLPEDHHFLNPRKSADIIAEALTHWLGEEESIGIGHSMGGMTTTLLQAKHHPFKAIGLFGSSAGGLEWGLSAPKDYINSPRTDLVVLENTGHNHFAFKSIETLCERLDYWASNNLD